MPSNRVEEAPAESGTGSPPPVSGRQHFQGQTEMYVEDIADNEDGFTSTEMQCDPIYDEPLEPPPIYEVKEGMTLNGTQLDQWELANLDHAYDETAVNLADAVIMESLKQLQEEYELEALRRQHEYHKCLRNKELALLSKYKIAQAKHDEQKKYLETHKPWDETLDQLIGKIGFDKIRDIAPTHFLDSQTDQAIYEIVRDSMEPQIHDDALQALARTQTGRELLNAIIEDTVVNRESEFAGRMYIGDPAKKGSLATTPSRMSVEFEGVEFEGEWAGEYDGNPNPPYFPGYGGYPQTWSEPEVDQVFDTDIEQRATAEAGSYYEDSSPDQQDGRMSSSNKSGNYSADYAGDEEDDD